MDKVLKRGFTLAELLIALAILGVIATFTIPKVLQAQQASSWKSAAKETAAMISGAYDVYKLQNGPSAAMKTSDLTPYMNYVARDTVTTIDNTYGGGGTLTCNGGGNLCLRLHNGGMLFMYFNIAFGNTASTNGIYFLFDPDGKADPNSRSVSFILYYLGKIVTEDGVNPEFCDSSPNCYGPNPGAVPPWFSWN